LAHKEIYVQVYDNYDRKFVDWVGNIIHRDYPVARVFASPERAFAEMKKMLDKKSAAVGKNSPSVVPLPFISISRTFEDFDPTRYNRHELRRLFSNSAGTECLSVKWPIPVNIRYQLDVWAMYGRDMSSIKQQYKLLFWEGGRDYLLEVRHPVYLNDPSRTYADAYYDMRIPLFNEGIVNNSDLEPGEQRRKVLRETFTLRAEGWIFAPADLAKQVLSVTTTIAQMESDGTEGDTLDTIVVTDSD